MRNIAVILAGGIGSRIGGNIPKQLLPLDDGRTVLEHAVCAFEQAPDICEICVVIHPDHIADVEALRLRNTWHKLSHIIPGGADRSLSTRATVSLYTDLLPAPEHDATNLLLHDAARPFISPDIIAGVCAALLTHPAVTVAVPLTDTLYHLADDAHTIASIPPRAQYMRAQTPQAFRLSLLDQAYRRAEADHTPPAATDDCGFILHYLPHTTIHIVPGNEQNRKITYKQDLPTQIQ